MASISSRLLDRSSGLGLLGPYLTGQAIDEYIRPGDLPGLARLCVLMIGVYLVTALSIWLQRYAMVGASQRAIQEIRNDLFSKLQTLSLRFFDQRTHGELMSRLANDVENVSAVLTESLRSCQLGHRSRADVYRRLDRAAELLTR